MCCEGMVAIREILISACKAEVIDVGVQGAHGDICRQGAALVEGRPVGVDSSLRYVPFIPSMVMLRRSMETTVSHLAAVIYQEHELFVSQGCPRDRMGASRGTFRLRVAGEYPRCCGD